MTDRTPGRHEAGSSVKAGTAAALITDHERKAVAAPVLYFHVRDGTNDASELHGHSHRRPTSSVGSADDQTLSPKDGFKHGSGAIPAKPRADSETGHRFAPAVFPPHQTPEPRRTHRAGFLGPASEATSMRREIGFPAARSSSE
jgi:hypothetical protein